MKFNILSEIGDLSNIRLTTIQQGVLLSIFLAKTPELAYAETVGSERRVAATELLHNTGLIKRSAEEAAVTSDGYDLLISSGLISPDTDRITDDGEDAVNNFRELDYTVREGKVPSYDTLKA